MIVPAISYTTVLFAVFGISTTSYNISIGFRFTPRSVTSKSGVDGTVQPLGRTHFEAEKAA